MFSDIGLADKKKWRLTNTKCPLAPFYSNTIGAKNQDR